MARVPNAIRFSGNVEPNTIKVRGYQLGINSNRIYSPTSQTNFYVGYTPPSGGYTIYLNKATMGPSVYVPQNDTEVIDYTNKISFSSFTTSIECFDWFGTQNDKIIVNIDYPDIVTDGLITLLDPGFIPSYTQTGNTVIDLSYSGNNGILINNVQFLDVYYGVFQFSAINSQYIYLPQNLYIPNGGPSFSVSVWFKTNQNGVIFGQQDTPTPNLTSGYVPAIYVDTDGKLRTSCFWGGGIGNQSVSNQSVNDNNWHEATITFSGTTHKTYLDGVLIDTLVKEQTIYGNDYYYFLATGESDGWTNAPNQVYFEGQIGVFLFYNKELTLSEVESNFQSFAQRYNVVPTPTPTVTVTPTFTPTITPSLTPSLTPTITPTNTITPSITSTNTPTISITPTITPSITSTNTPTISITPTITPSITSTSTPINTSTPTVTSTNTPTPTISITPSVTQTNTVTPSQTPTISITPSITPTIGGITPYSQLNTIAAYLRNYMSEFRNPSFYTYQLDGTGYYILDGGNDMYDNGNITSPWLKNGTVYTGTTAYSSAIYPSAITYTNTATTVIDSDFGYVSLGYVQYSPPTPQNSTYHPLTVLGARSVAGQPVGFQIGGNSGADGGGTLASGYIYNNDIISGFTVYAYFRETYAASDPSHCNLFILLGHPSWNSVFGTVSAAAQPVSVGGCGGYLYTSGASTSNVLTVQTLLSKAGGAQVTSAECQTVVNNFIIRIKEAVGFADVTPTPTPTNTITPSITPTITPTISLTPSLTPTISITPSITKTITPTPSITPSITPTISLTPSITPTISLTPSITKTVTPTISLTPSITPSITPTKTVTPTITTTNTPTKTTTPTVTPSPNYTPIALKLLVLGDGNASSVASTIGTGLTAQGYSGFITSGISTSTTYTGTDLTGSNWNVVLYYTNSAQYGSTSLSNNLRTFVNNGNGLVTATFAWNLYPVGFDHTLTCFGTAAQSAKVITVNYSGHPITTGLSGTLTNGVSTFMNSVSTLQSGSTLISTFQSDGSYFAAVNTVGSARLVSVNTWPSNVTTYSNLRDFFARSVLWAGQYIS
jgi:hypothetical protein